MLLDFESMHLILKNLSANNLYWLFFFITNRTHSGKNLHFFLNALTLVLQLVTAFRSQAKNISFRDFQRKQRTIVFNDIPWDNNRTSVFPKT